MNTTNALRILALLAAGHAAFTALAQAQSLSGNLSFTSAGSFANPTAQSSGSVYLIDNTLTDGYATGFDLKDIPSSLNPTAPIGSAAFQWGKASSTSAYPHTSALIFRPLAVSNATAEKPFNIAQLTYRNGTIVSQSGSSSVDLALRMSFSEPLGLDPIDVTFSMDLINTVNSSDPIASADIVSLHSLSAPVNFTDAMGNRYYLELTFQVDKDTLDGTLSTEKEFRVFEGGGGTATLLGRFTTVPAGNAIPEPSGAMLVCVGGVMFALRRRRSAVATGLA